MKEEQDYIRDITEIRSMMERSSKFLSLSGWAGIMAGLYALAGAFVANNIFHFNPGEMDGNSVRLEGQSYSITQLITLAIAVLIVAGISAIYFSHRKANKNGEKLWNYTTRQLLISMIIPLAAGGILILILISKGLIGFAAPLSLLFYGLALYNASKFTIVEVRILGIIQICLGLISSQFISNGLLFWALGFGVGHIIYGIYMHIRYEK